MPGPLEGVRIVELGTMIAVPAATHLLTTQGATVVKVENTALGDDLRRYGSQRNGLSGWFANANAGKRSIALDLQSAAGKEVLWGLIARADVVVQGFRPGVVDRLGFGADAVLARHPGIVFVSSSGFGADGPYRDRPVFDPIIQALSGWAGGQTVDGQPMLVKGMVADKVAAITTAQAITAALVSKGRTGRGQHVELSMLESNIAFLWPDVMMHATVLADDATHMPNLLGVYRLTPAADGWVSVTAGTDAQWAALCEVMERPDLAERFATAALRNADMPAWFAAFDEMCSTVPADELLARCVAADVPAVPVMAPAEVVDDEQVVARGAVRVVEHPHLGPMRSPRQGARFHGDGEGDPSPAPLHGEHTDEILAELGLGDAEIVALREAGVVR